MAAAGEGEYAQALNQAVGYGVVVGLSAAFALLIMGLSYLQGRYTRFKNDSAMEFAAASRSLKPGLICVGIVSAWTWSATLLQSSVATYQSGLSAAWWYGVGGTVQIAWMAVIAAKVKQNANGCVTFLQIVKARYGLPCHLLFTLYALVCAHIVSGSVILGASATMNALTGINVWACNFLLPVGIGFYVFTGGLRATFISDYTHTIVIFIGIFIFMFTSYTTSDILGSPSALYDKLVAAAEATPVVGNAEGSYLTMKSNSGILFGGCTLATGFAGVFCDQGYWQRAIASRPQSTTKAYMLGGLSWFAIPWTFGTTMGLSARGLITHPNFPTFPYPLSAAQQSAGLVAPAAATVLLGKGGGVMVLLLVFLAAVSTASAELISTSSIIVYDIIGTYFRPLNERQTVFSFHASICVLSVWLGAWSCILHVANIDLGWLFYVQGVMLTPAVFPIGATVCWAKMSKWSALFGTLIGQTCGMLGWMLGCYKVYGEINIRNLALPYSAISGSAPGLIMSTLATIVIALIWPSEYDWSTTRAIGETPEAVIETKQVDADADAEYEGKEKDMALSSVAVAVDGAGNIQSAPTADGHGNEDTEALRAENDDSKYLDLAVLQRVFWKAAIVSTSMAFIIAILVPLPLFLTNYIYSKPFFTFWIAVSFIWIFCAAVSCVLLPIWESREALWQIIKRMTGRS